MTLPVPPASISLSQIQTQFGGATPTKLSEYYANGTYVPSGTEGIYGPIPESGEISLHDFYGAPYTGISISSGIGGNLSGGTATSTFILSNNGFPYGQCTKTTSTTGQLRINGVGPSNPVTNYGPILLSPSWISLVGPSPTSLYEARATWVSSLGTATPSNVGTWLSLGTSRSWTLTSTSTGISGEDNDGTLTVQIRAIATPGTILYTYSVILRNIGMI